MRRYEERLALLQRLADRLERAGLPTSIDRFTPNSAPRDESESWIPALRLGEDGTQQVRVLYWSGTPMFVYQDLVTRYRTDDGGIEDLVSLIIRERRNRRRGAFPAEPCREAAADEANGRTSTPDH